MSDGECTEESVNLFLFLFLFIFLFLSSFNKQIFHVQRSVRPDYSLKKRRRMRRRKNKNKKRKKKKKKKKMKIKKKRKTFITPLSEGSVGMILRSEEKASLSDCVRWRSRTLAMTRCECRSSKGWSSRGPSGVGASDTTAVHGLFLPFLGPDGSRPPPPPGGLPPPPPPPVLLSSAWPRTSFLLGNGERLRFAAWEVFLAPRSSSSSLAPRPPSGELVQDTSSLIAASADDLYAQARAASERTKKAEKSDEIGKKKKNYKKVLSLVGGSQELHRRGRRFPRRHIPDFWTWRENNNKPCDRQLRRRLSYSRAPTPGPRGRLSVAEPTHRGAWPGPGSRKRASTGRRHGGKRG
ncbi:hypothetical protein EYF80_056648 [Liparis tanakae]|uniref:Uncharacterized protein n=1 Tax=Liparis tanakae TaxID=230148 RepID=A0A4Z2EWA1_9TELE|nr:hypothetical protein EYF80_056648 [Liparis tanakae]